MLSIVRSVDTLIHPQLVIRAIQMGEIRRRLSISSGFFFFAISLCLCVSPLRAESSIVDGRVVQVTLGDVYIDIGSNAGLKKNDVGTLMRNGGEINRVQVVELSRRSARLEVVNKSPLRRAAMGDAVIFIVIGEWDASPAVLPSPQASPVGAQKKEEEFVPLLAPLPKEAASRAKNIFHGSMKLRYVDRLHPDQEQNYSQSRFTADGSVDRINATAWSATWLADIYYRNGPAYQSSPDYQKPDLELYNVSLQTKFHGGGFFKMGRFLPMETSEMGYVDGVQIDSQISPAVHLGAMAGYTPNSANMQFQTKEPMVVPYVNFSAGKRQSLYSSSLIGFYNAFYDGKIDRRTLLFNEQLDITSKVNFIFNSQTDFDVGSSTHSHPPAQLTRLNMALYSPIFSFWTFRAGYDRSMQPDTQAIRAVYGPTVNEAIFDQVLIRSWVGSNFSMIWNLQLDADLSKLYNQGTSTPPQYRFILSRVGLFSNTQGRLSATAYNIFENGFEYPAAALSCYLPFLRGKLLASANIDGRTFPDGASKRFQSTDYSFRLDARASRNIGFYGGFTHTYAVYAISNLINCGVDYSW